MLNLRSPGRKRTTGRAVRGGADQIHMIGPTPVSFFYSPASYLLPSSFILIHPGASLHLSSPVTFRFPLALSFSLLDPEPTEDASRCEPTESDEVKIDASRHESTESEEAKISRGEQGRGRWEAPRQAARQAAGR